MIHLFQKPTKLLYIEIFDRVYSNRTSFIENAKLVVYQMNILSKIIHVNLSYSYFNIILIIDCAQKTKSHTFGRVQ